MTRRLLGGLMTTIGLLLIVPGCLLWCFEFAALDAEMHISIHERLGTADEAGISVDDMRLMSHILVDYLSGARDDLGLPIYARNGVPLIGSRMSQHMIDVRGLFTLERNVRIGLLGIGAILSSIGLFLRKGDWKKQLKTKSLISVCAWVALLLAGVGAATMDFTGLFARFHRLLFTNDLWLLDPATDSVILLLSESFFLQVGLRAAAYMIIPFVLFLVVPRVVERASA